MQLLRTETKSKGSTGQAASPGDGCAEAVLNIAPPVVRAIRKMMREHRLPELSVPQFRTLGLLTHCPDASLSAVADHIGSSLPAASRMIDGLVAKNLIARKQCCHDRRQVSLELTPLGREAFLESRNAAQLQLAERLSGLSAGKKEAIVQAMRWLGEVFGSDAEMATKAPRGSSNGNS
jgi:DNA-binding MarR family transcriptional regulator